MSILNKTRIFAVALIAGVGGSLLAAAPAQAAPTAESSLAWTIETDGEPQTGELSGAGVGFQSLRDRSINRFNVSSGSTYWSIALAAPFGEELHPGRYVNAERAGFQSGRAPGLEVTFNSGGCNEVYGSFTIHQIAFDAEGTVSMLEATFTRYCESPDAHPVTGTLKFNAFPLSYRYTLTDEVPETAPSHTYRGATSLFFAQTFWTNSIRFGVSGDRRSDIVEFSPPAGETLEVGRTYRNVQPVGQQDPGRAGLSVERFACRPTTGNFTIHELVRGPDGEPTALSATFALKCPQIPSPENPRILKGVIHYNA